MPIYALEIDEFIEENFLLIAIHTPLEDYKLAYLLNKNLKTQLFKSEKILELFGKKNNALFSLYSYTNSTYDSDWFLIANGSYTKPISKSSELLFVPETKTYLISEMKNVDFFLKITRNLEDSFINKTIEKIKSIENIITSYLVDKNTLKSKDFLIF